MTNTKEAGNAGVAVTGSDVRTAGMVAALIAVPNMPETSVAAIKMAADVFANRSANLTPNLGVAGLAARRSGMSSMAYDGSGLVLFGANRNRDGSVLNPHAEPYLIVRENGKGWHSRTANIGQDFPNGLKGTVEPQFVSYLAAVLAAESEGKRFAAVRAILAAGADEDYAIRNAFLAAVRTGTVGK